MTRYAPLLALLFTWALCLVIVCLGGGDYGEMHQEAPTSADMLPVGSSAEILSTSLSPSVTVPAIRFGWDIGSDHYFGVITSGTIVQGGGSSCGVDHGDNPCPGDSE